MSDWIFFGVTDWVLAQEPRPEGVAGIVSVWFSEVTGPKKVEINILARRYAMVWHPQPLAPGQRCRILRVCVVPGRMRRRAGAPYQASPRRVLRTPLRVKDLRTLSKKCLVLLSIILIFLYIRGPGDFTRTT